MTSLMRNVVDLQSCDIILCDFSQNVYYVNGSLYWDSHLLSICLQIRAGICAVLTADAVVTGEVKCYNFVVQLCSLLRFAETISQGYCSAAQWPLAVYSHMTDPHLLYHMTGLRRHWSGLESLFVIPSCHWTVT